MGRGGRTKSKHSSNSRVRVKNVESEDSDLDYEVEIDDQSDSLDSLIGDDSKEEELEDEDWRTVVKPRTRKVLGSPTKKRSTRRPNKSSRVPSDHDDDHDDNEDDDDDDDDDDEFRPDDEYTEEEDENFEEEEEEEEEFLFQKNTRKRGRTDINEKTSLRRRTRFRDDKDFLEVGPSLRDRTWEKPARRKKRVAGGSDISKKEQEQVREDNQIHGTNLGSPRKTQEDDPKINVGKGKEKAEEEGEKKDVGMAVCGICLTEEGKNTVRGTLDCCDHYFCFACIFEWSKVETRCPLCKQRFVSVSKRARCLTEFGVRDTVIAVPERNQVYQPSEEELQNFLNPYENVICTECHQGGDDALMLLCDLCDSPSHTYCVGLGHEVPEGNWYCNGCKPGALGPSNSQTQNPNRDQRTNPEMSNRTSVYENMSEIDLNVTIPETLISQGNGFSRFSSGSIGASSPPGMGVATVSGRRLIHEQIRRHILSNRLSQTSSDVVGPSHLTHYVERLQENPSQSVQIRNSFPRLVHMMGSGVGQPASSVNGLTHTRGGWSELDRLNSGVGRSPIMVSAQLQPCTSRSSVGPGIGTSFFDPRYYEEQSSTFKQQVQTMVRNQVKSISLNVNLGHNDYVEILRRSAYTIMAAMGLEPPRLDTYTVQLPTCPHLGNRSANMATSPTYNCCVTCFEGFVKDVVNKMMGTIVQPHLFNFRR